MVIIEVNLSGPIEPGALPELLRKCREVLPPGGTEGVVLSGRMPVWAYGALVHEYHPRPWVATFDPRLGGAVIVASHSSNKQVGQVVSIDGMEHVVVEF